MIDNHLCTQKNATKTIFLGWAKRCRARSTGWLPKLLFSVFNVNILLASLSMQKFAICVQCKSLKNRWHWLQAIDHSKSALNHPPTLLFSGWFWQRLNTNHLTTTRNLGNDFWDWWWLRIRKGGGERVGRLLVVPLARFIGSRWCVVTISLGLYKGRRGSLF